MSVIRQVIQSPIDQGADEDIVYQITTTPWGSSPGSSSAKIYSYAGDDENDTASYTDVTSTNMTGAASESGDVVTLPAIDALVAGSKYRVEVQFTCSGNVFEPYFWIHAER